MRQLILRFAGHRSECYSVRIGVPAGVKDQGFSFSLKTPDRTYNLSAQSEAERDHWIEVIERVIDRPLTPQDLNSNRIPHDICYEKYLRLFIVSGRLVRKRANTNSINLFSPR